MSEKQKNLYGRKLTFDVLEDRRVLAAGWNIIDIPNGPLGVGITQPTDGSQLTLIRDDRTERLRPDGSPRVPKYRLPNDAADQIFGTLASPFVTQSGVQNIVDLRFRFPPNENVSGFQLVSLDSDERIRDIIPWVDNGAAIPAALPAQVECFNYDTGVSLGTTCGPRRVVATAEPNVGQYFDGADFMLVDGVLTGAGGPENFDRFAYFVPSATVTPTAGSTLVSEGGSTDSVNVRIDSSLSLGLARPDLVGNDVFGVEFRVQSSDPSQLEVLTPTFSLNHTNWQTGMNIQVRAVDDGIVDGTVNASILISVADNDGDGFASSDKLFDPYQFAPVPVSVLDNDATVNVVSPDVLVVEGSGDEFDVSLVRSGVTDSVLDIPFMITGDAIKDSDYEVLGALSMNGNSGIVRFQPNSQQQTLRFVVNDDVLIESDETINIAFDDGPTYSFSSVSGVNGLTIMDNDPGDFDSDGDYDCDDIDQIAINVAAGSNDLTYDVNRDGLLDRGDVDAWLAAAGARNLASGQPYLPGDLNLDGSVDTSDFNVWNENKFTLNPFWCDGDLNGDGVIDTSDFNIWNENKFMSSLSGLPVTADRKATSRIEKLPRTFPDSPFIAAIAPVAEDSLALSRAEVENHSQEWRHIDSIWGEQGSDETNDRKF